MVFAVTKVFRNIRHSFLVIFYLRSKYQDQMPESGVRHRRTPITRTAHIAATEP
jgi:hypothetical protein